MGLPEFVDLSRVLICFYVVVYRGIRVVITLSSNIIITIVLGMYFSWYVYMDNNDCYNTNVPKETLETQNNFISERGEQLHGFYLKHSDETIKYLLYVNAGGAAISIGFMGASESIRNLICLRIALSLFAIGLVCVGILRVILLCKTKYLFDNWQKDVKKYWKSQIKYTELIENDDKRSGSARRAFIVGYISLVSFIIGLILGGVSLFFNY